MYFVSVVVVVVVAFHGNTEDFPLFFPVIERSECDE